MLVKLERDKALLLVIDFQEKLLPAIQDHESCEAAAGRLIAGAQVLKLSVVATEQYPAGLGPTVPSIRQLLAKQAVFEKIIFSANIAAVRDAIRNANRTQIIVAGVETHVCVQQTVLDLLRDGLAVWVCADAVGSRRPYDRDIALERMRHAGAAITTTESVLFELLGQAVSDTFKQILKIVK